MFLIVGFLGGAIAASAAIGIWYFTYFRSLVQQRQTLNEWRDKVQSAANGVKTHSAELQAREQQHKEAVAELDGRRVQFEDLRRENAGLKQDLFNLSVELKKTDRDHAALALRQEEITERTNELAQRYLKENVDWNAAKLNPNNFSTCKKRLLKVIESCREIGFDVPKEQEEQLVEELKQKYERIVREQFQREEQARIRAQIREEEKIARDADKLIREAEREQETVQKALEKALAEAKDEHSAEVELLRTKLREAQEKAERAKSQAQLTKAGYVYVCSNFGSFGEDVFKIGMTRRLEPMDRVKELGDASVPFPFDVHMMISCDDAPSLENALHREFHRQRVNKVNFRKEYFRTDIEAIRRIVEELHGEVDYVADPEALQYRETEGMPDEDFDFIEKTMESLESKGESDSDED